MSGEIRHHLQALLRKLGLSESDSAVLSTLVLSRTPLSAEELSKRTGYSLASISLSLTRLRKNYMVEKRREGGRYIYWPAKGVVENFTSFLREILEGHVKPFLRALEVEEDRAFNDLRRELRELERTLKGLVERG
ncbi:MAG: hypothetical protein J7L88_01915 [Thermoplasmata archaeon]|nr:hypothetical protein [Thermoplasmata archaeon]